jgi:hypothetical protein
MNRDGNFQCDIASKQRVMEAMRDAYAPNIFTYEIDPDPYAKIDCLAIGITKNGKTIHYAIECKQRNFTPSKYNTYYCEPSKYATLNWARLYDNVDRALIANEFSDGTILLWNVNDLDPNDTEDVRIARTTVGIGDYLSQKIEQRRILMHKEKAIRIK